MKEHAVNDVVTRHLLEAIERVRDDVAKVEFWAGAVAGFAQPIPEYTPDEASVWLPTEQAAKLRKRQSGPRDNEAEPDRKSHSRSRGR